ncbi:MAG: aldose epimerase family protein [Clostridia bacterium]
MSLSTRPFGVTPSGLPVTEYTLTNAGGASVSILDFGGIVTRILVPDRQGRLADVNLSLDDLTTYANDQAGSMGALIGRVGNRIGGAAFDLEGKHYPLVKNNGENNLHGGPVGFGIQLWQATQAPDENALTLTLVSADGDQGFPGTLRAVVTYSFDDQCALGIHYHATTDQPTLCNLTNHCYFNLDGHDAGTVENLELQIFAEAVNEVTPDLIPTGKLVPADAVPYCFAQPMRIGDVLRHTQSDPTMKAAGGVDFNYCAGRDRETKTIAVLHSPKTGRVMEVITDQPGVQCYTGQGLNHAGKDGVTYGRFGGVCLETQHYPDAIHHPQFPSIVLRPQDVYDTHTTYRFGVK